MATENERRQKRKYIIIIAIVAIFAVIGTGALFVGGMALAHWEALERSRADLEWELVYGSETSCEAALAAYRDDVDSPFTALLELVMDIEPAPSSSVCIHTYSSPPGGELDRRRTDW